MSDGFNPLSLREELHHICPECMCGERMEKKKTIDKPFLIHPHKLHLSDTSTHRRVIKYLLYAPTTLHIWHQLVKSHTENCINLLGGKMHILDGSFTWWAAGSMSCINEQRNSHKFKTNVSLIYTSAYAHNHRSPPISLHFRYYWMLSSFFFFGLVHCLQPLFHISVHEATLSTLITE